MKPSSADDEQPKAREWRRTANRRAKTAERDGRAPPAPAARTWTAAKAREGREGSAPHDAAPEHDGRHGRRRGQRDAGRARVRRRSDGRARAGERATATAAKAGAGGADAAADGAIAAAAMATDRGRRRTRGRDSKAIEGAERHGTRRGTSRHAQPITRGTSPTQPDADEPRRIEDAAGAGSIRAALRRLAAAAPHAGAERSEPLRSPETHAATALHGARAPRRYLSGEARSRSSPPIPVPPQPVGAAAAGRSSAKARDAAMAPSSRAAPAGGASASMASVTGRRIVARREHDHEERLGRSRRAGDGRSLRPRRRRRPISHLRVYTTRLLGRDPQARAAWRRQHLGEDHRRRSPRRRRPTCSASRARAGTWRTSSRPACRRCGSTACASCARATRSPTRTWCACSAPTCIDPAAPNPSVETLLHAFLPHKFVDHTHATAVLEPRRSAGRRSDLRARSMTAARASCPTSCRASRSRKAAADVFEQAPGVEGLILHKHGIFTFGDDARAKPMSA